MTWVLIIFVGIGGMRSEESNALAVVPGFVSQEQCNAAAKKAREELAEGAKRVLASCVPQGRAAP